MKKEENRDCAITQRPVDSQQNHHKQHFPFRLPSSADQQLLPNYWLGKKNNAKTAYLVLTTWTLDKYK